MEFDMEKINAVAHVWGLKLVAAVAILIIGRIVAKILAGMLRKGMERAKMDKALVSFTGNIAYALMIAFVFIAALGELGVETTSLAAIIAAAGLAIGLSLQGSLSNLASGFMIILFRPFRVGDFIEAAGTSGSVHDLSIFTTTLKTPDNKTVIVPNGNITSDTITNYSTEPTRRLDMVFGVGYDDDLEKVRAILLEELNNDDRVLKDPEPVVAVGELADSSINFVARPWVKKEDYWGLKFDLQMRIKQRFDKEGISIPFPQQDVHMHTVAPEVPKAAKKTTTKKAATKSSATKKKAA